MSVVGPEHERVKEKRLRYSHQLGMLNNFHHFINSWFDESMQVGRDSFQSCY